MRNRGFSIAELMVALVIMAIIMITIGNVMTTMVRQTLQTNVKSQVAGDAGVAMDIMERDIQYSTYLNVAGIYPSINPGNSFGVCADWSSDMTGGAGAPVTGAQYDTVAKSSYTIYCVAAAGGGTIYQYATLWRYNNTTANCNAFPTLPGGCGAKDSLNTAPTVIVQGNGTSTGISRADCCENGSANNYYFKQSNDVNGVEIHYIVGNSTPASAGAPANPGGAYQALKAGTYVPVYYKIDTKVDMNRSYNNGGG